MEDEEWQNIALGMKSVMMMGGKDEVGGMCSYWWVDANLGIRSTPLATSSDSQMVKIFAFYSRAATVASTLQPNIVTPPPCIIPSMQKPTKPGLSLPQTPR